MSSSNLNQFQQRATEAEYLLQQLSRRLDEYERNKNQNKESKGVSLGYKEDLLKEVEKFHYFIDLK